MAVDGRGHCAFTRHFVDNAHGAKQQEGEKEGRRERGRGRGRKRERGKGVQARENFISQVYLIRKVT